MKTLEALRDFELEGTLYRTGDILTAGPVGASRLKGEGLAAEITSNDHERSKMKKILLSHDIKRDGVTIPAGSTISLDIKTAAQVVADGHGSEVKPGKVVNHNAEKVETRDPVAATRDPAPAPAGETPPAAVKPATKRGQQKPTTPRADPASAPAAETPPPADPAPAAETAPEAPAADTPPA